MTEVTEAMIAAGLTYDLKTWRRAGDDDAYYSAIYLAMEAARIPAAPGDVERDTAVRAWFAGARAVHDEWAKADEGERFYLSRDHEPDFTEAAYDYAADLTDHTTKDDE